MAHQRHRGPLVRMARCKQGWHCHSSAVLPHEGMPRRGHGSKILGDFRRRA